MARKTKITRKIGGKRYSKLHKTPYSRKSDAEDAAEKWRKKGINVRVVAVKDGYWVYGGGKRERECIKKCGM